MAILLLIWFVFCAALASLLGASTTLAAVIATGTLVVPLLGLLVAAVVAAIFEGSKLDRWLNRRRIAKARRKRIERYARTRV